MIGSSATIAASLSHKMMSYGSALNVLITCCVRIAMKSSFISILWIRAKFPKDLGHHRILRLYCNN